MTGLRHIKLIILTFMFVCVQYQIWGGDVGFRLTSQLSDELSALNSQNSYLQSSNHNVSQSLSDASRKELHDEQMRQVYHMMSSNEKFVSIESPNDGI